MPTLSKRGNKKKKGVIVFYVVEVKPMKKAKRKYEVNAKCPDDAKYFACEKARAEGYHVWMEETKVLH